MAKKPEGNKVVPAASAPPARSVASLRELRTRIDKLDLEILRLVNERASVASEIGRIKTESGEEVFSPAREEEVLQNVVAVNNKNDGALNEVCVRAIFREIM